MSTNWVLTQPRLFDFVRTVVPDVMLASTLDELPECAPALIGFCTIVIVPKDFLTRFNPKRMYNFHPGSPRYPGIDAHRWACYEDAENFGATAHFMTKRVDEGAIVGSLVMSIRRGGSAELYRQMGEHSAKYLFAALAPRMLAEDISPSGEVWNGPKRFRRESLEMCKVENCDELERARRAKAFAGVLPD